MTMPKLQKKDQKVFPWKIPTGIGRENRRLRSKSFVWQLEESRTETLLKSKEEKNLKEGMINNAEMVSDLQRKIVLKH